MIKDEEFRRKLSSWGFLSGLWFKKTNIPVNENKIKNEDKIKFVIKEEKRAVRIAEDNKQIVKRKEKKQRFVEWQKSKRKSHYVDVKVNPQKVKNRWYNWYDVANKLTKENDSEEIKRWKYE